ncbi:MAG TPA: YCF48-related protein [Mucilaginibacter sp.]|nr:YCF48-related protein [Mucilaginibacter sp.]
MIKHILLSSLFILFIASLSFAQRIEVLQQGKPTSIRGLSVVNDNVAWISGSKGYISITTDGGKTWNWQQVKGFEKADFRDIEAFSDKEAVIMSSGTPALVLKTTDGGVNWKVKYNNPDTAYFLDAMDFADAQHGWIMGDPIKNKFLLLATADGGETWAPVKNAPEAFPNEAAFAASGTCIRTDKLITIITGGSHARMLVSQADDIKWKYINLPFKQGKASQGGFSVARGAAETVVVGGDYENDKAMDSLAVVFPIQSDHMSGISQQGPAGFQSCVEYISGSTYLSTGTPGSNITTDGGKKWIKIDATSYNVCRKAKQGKLVLLAGNGGKIALFKL